MRLSLLLLFIILFTNSSHASNINAPVINKTATLYQITYHTTIQGESFINFSTNGSLAAVWLSLPNATALGRIDVTIIPDGTGGSFVTYNYYLNAFPSN